MKRISIVTMLASAVAAGALLLGTGSARADDVCEAHGTTVDFFESPAVAAKRALKEEKLVFVLHVSGHFEVPDYT